MSGRNGKHTTAEFDLLFVRDLKRRLKRLVRDLEQVEKTLKKADAFERQAKATPAQVDAALKFYKTLALSQEETP